MDSKGTKCLYKYSLIHSFIPLSVHTTIISLPTHFLSVYPSIYPPAHHSSIYPSVCPSCTQALIHLSLYPSIHTIIIYPPTHPFIHVPTHPSSPSTHPYIHIHTHPLPPTHHSFIHLSTHVFIQPASHSLSTYPPNLTFIYPSIYLPVHLPTCPSIYPHPLIIHSSIRPSFHPSILLIGIDGDQRIQR